MTSTLRTSRARMEIPRQFSTIDDRSQRCRLLTLIIAIYEEWPVQS